MKLLYFFIISFSLLVTYYFNLATAQQPNQNEIVPLEKMAKLEGLLGPWETTNYAYSDGEWKQIATSKVTFLKKLKGKLITEEISNLTPATGFIVETFISYDQYRKTYRLAAVDDTFGLMDIYEGDWVDDALFQLTNLRAGTNFPTQDGGSMYFRLSFTELSTDKREFLVERSNDNGMTWSPMNKNEMSRIK
ncbi:MAG: DUF1579 family protein [Kordiimonadaceae bacterium]|nr:DUF1579 family protein [Kordiimonadaceae bacterium]MBT6031781.1 DUF1579 family protein [Kordiimonadaceae bacterium]